MKQHKTAALLSYINIIITNILGILVTPYVIRMLGDAEYGLYTLIGAFVGYLSILDLGLNSTIVRFTAQYRAEQNKEKEENFLAISLLIYGFMGLLIVLVGIMFYLNIELLFSKSLSISQIEQAKIMMLILIGNIAITIPGGAFTGICTGYEKFVFPKIISILKYLLRAFLIVVILYSGADAIGIVILDTILNITFIIITMYYVFQHLKVRIKLHSFKVSYIKNIFKYSLWVFLFTLVYNFQWRSGQMILGVNFDTTVVAIYGVGVMLGIYFTTFGNVINGLLIPKAVQSIHSGFTNQVLSDQLVKVGRISLFVLFYVFGSFLLFGEEFIYLWVGDSYKESWLVAILIMAVYIIPLSNGYATAILEARKLLKFKSIIFLVCNILGMILGTLLAINIGIYGMIYGLATGIGISQIIMLYYYHTKIGLNMIQFFKSAIWPLLIPFGIVLIIGHFLEGLFEYNWMTFILKCIVYSICFCSVFFFKLNKYEKSLLINFNRSSKFK